MRLLIALHRYLGIAVGWLVVLWCLSGIVMIYVPYPAPSLSAYVEALPELDLSRCCSLAVGDSWLAEIPAGDFSIEMYDGEPVMSLPAGYGESTRISLADGRVLARPTIDELLRDAERRTAHWPARGPVTLVGETGYDQWTVQYARPEQSLYRVALGDAQGTEWYLSAADGGLVQRTTARERFWNYPGAVVHWLYFTPLRALGRPWAETVIWLTLAALALTVIGAVLGIARARFGRGVGLSPYRGLARWHHWLGLCCGVLTLTWLTSGLLSMNPWGLLAGSGPGGEATRLEGEQPTLAALSAQLAGWRKESLPAGTTYLEGATLGGAVYVIAYDRDGARQRLDGRSLAPAPLDEAALLAAAGRLQPDTAILSAGLMHTPDAYYYDHKTPNAWPVYRVILDDGPQTRYYLDPATGRILDRIDSARGAYRWLFTALHSLDFAAIVRIRPFWDLLMIVSLLGVAAVAATGTWLGFRYLARGMVRR